MTEHLLAGLLLAAGALLLIVPAFHALLGEDTEAEDAARLRRAARREELRQQMDAHPVSRTDWQMYRREQSERLRRPYMGVK